jgi:predicted DCC family thiol-disulfide oxidoreductase YuxK
MVIAASTLDAGHSAVLLYDGECAFCRKSVSILRRLDWLQQIQYQNCRDTANLPRSAVPLLPEQLLEQMHLVTPDRRHVYRGFAAFRWMAWRLPLLWAIAPLLYIPGVPKVGQRIYLWIARNRFQIVPCEHGACKIPTREAARGPSR